jgi:hypothetical protein
MLACRTIPSLLTVLESSRPTSYGAPQAQSENRTMPAANSTVPIPANPAPFWRQSTSVQPSTNCAIAAGLTRLRPNTPGGRRRVPQSSTFGNERRRTGSLVGNGLGQTVI